MVVDDYLKNYAQQKGLFGSGGTDSLFPDRDEVNGMSGSIQDDEGGASDMGGWGKWAFYIQLFLSGGLQFSSELDWRFNKPPFSGSGHHIKGDPTRGEEPESDPEDNPSRSECKKENSGSHESEGAAGGGYSAANQSDCESASSDVVPFLEKGGEARGAEASPDSETPNTSHDLHLPTTKEFLEKNPNGLVTAHI